jgi:site-specific recombinase XerD
MYDGEFEHDDDEWYKKIDEFLSKFDNPHTKRAYSAAITEFGKWTHEHRTNMRHFTGLEAEEYLKYLLLYRKLSTASVRRDIAALTTFYNFVYAYTGLSNPFNKVTTQFDELSEELPENIYRIPGTEEIKVILGEVPAVEKAIILAIVNKGFYSGALPTLEKKDGHYSAMHRGNALMENDKPYFDLPKTVILSFKAAGLDENKPFAEFSATAIERRINNHVGKLYHAGLINAPYSCRDFRYYFSIHDFEKTHDIYRLGKILGHTNFQTTQNYLRRLGVGA